MLQLGERIKQRRKEKGITQDYIAQQLGMGRSNVGHIENGRTMPSADVITKIAEILDTSSDYLLGIRSSDIEKWENQFDKHRNEVALKEVRSLLRELAVGRYNDRLFKPQAQKILEAESVKLFSLYEIQFDCTPYDIVRVCKEVNDIEFTLDIIEILKRVKSGLSISDSGPVLSLPIVGRISCGKGVLAYEEIEGYEATPRSWLNGGEYFYLRAKGDSMTGARIQEGDLLLIRQQEEVEDGEIAAVLIGDDAVLKRVYRRGNSLWLQSENPNYAPIVLEQGGEYDVKIIGKLKKIVVSV